MKRILAFLIAFAVAAGVLLFAVFAMGSDNVKDGQYKIGMGTAVSLSNDEKGGVKHTVTVAAVITDSSGRIVDCVIDCGDFAATVTDGKVSAGEFKTKNELKEDYHMATASPIGKEWYEQAEYFADSVKGMDAKKVSYIGIDSTNGKTDNTDILAGCTISVGDIKKALVKAMGDTLAASFESESTPAISLALINDAGSSVDANENEDGAVEMTTSICAMASYEGKALAAVIDSASTSTEFDAAGKVLAQSFGATKRELLDSYGMKGASSIGNEWYEQADAFCAYIKGFDVKGIESIGIADDGKATDKDLLSGCTIRIWDFTKITAKALKAAK